MKGQINLEYINAAFLFILSIGIVIFISLDAIPAFEDQTETSELYYEATALSEKLLNTQGYTTEDGGTTKWADSADRIEDTVKIGLQDSTGNVSLSKIEALDPVSTSPGKINYSEFRSATGVSNQYSLDFTLKPVFEAHGSFLRTKPPSDPPVQEPDRDSYDNAGNRIFYGHDTVYGDDYFYLIVPHDNSYDTLYISKSWNFQDSETQRLQTDDRTNLYSRDLGVSYFTNAENTPGNYVLLGSRIHRQPAQYPKIR